MKLFKTLESEIYKQNKEDFWRNLGLFWDRWDAALIPVGVFVALILIVVAGAKLIDLKEINGRDYDRLADYDKSYSHRIPGFSEKIKEALSDNKVTGHEYNAIRSMMADHWEREEAEEAARNKKRLLEQIND